MVVSCTQTVYAQSQIAKEIISALTCTYSTKLNEKLSEVQAFTTHIHHPSLLTASHNNKRVHMYVKVNIKQLQSSNTY